MELPTGRQLPVLLLSKKQIDYPTSPNVRPRLMTVGQDVGVVAPCFFQGVGQNRQAVQGPVIVAPLSQTGHRAIVPAQPTGVKGGGRPEGVAEDAAQKSGLYGTLGLHRCGY